VAAAAPLSPPAPAAPGAPVPPPVGGFSPAPPPPAVAAAEQAAREAATQVAARTRAWWGRLDPTGKRPTLIVAGVLAAVVLGTQVLNGIIPVPNPSPAGPGTPIPGGGPTTPGGGPIAGARPIEVGMGVRVYAPPAWQQLDASGALTGIRLQNGSVVIDVRVTQFGGNHVDLVSAYVNQILQPDSQNLNVGQVNVVAGNGRTAARATYLGLFNGVTGSVEGELTAFVFPNGIGVIVDAWGAQGSLANAIAEIHAIIETIEVR
jgi:hypothetical protein